MKKLSLFVLAALVVSAPLVSPLAWADGKKNRPDTEIETAMDEMAGAFRKLKRQVADPAQNAASLGLVAAIRKGAQASREHTPLRAADVPEVERAAFTAKYRKALEAFLATLDRVEAALQSGKNEEAAKLVADLDQARKTGHKNFQRPEKDEKK